MSAPHVVVVGGGIAGLSAAHRLLERGRESGRVPRVTVVDGHSRLGGSVATERADGYLVEWGGDMFITDKPWAVSLCERLGIADRLITTNERFRRSLVLRAGKPLPVPEGFVLMAPTQLGAMARTSILSPLAKLRMAAEIALPRGPRGVDESIASFVRRRFGKEALERLVQPLVGGIYTGDPERLSLQATLPRFVDMEREHRSVIVGSLAQQRNRRQASGSGARYGLFVSFPDGLGELLGALRSRIAAGGAAFATGTRVEALTHHGAGFRLRLGDDDLVAEAVVLATSSWQAAPLVRGLSAPLASRLERIPYASTAIVVSGHRLADIRHPLDAFGLVVPHAEGRRVLAVSFASRKFDGRAPEGRVLLRTFVGGALQPELYELGDDAIVALVLEELADIFGVGGRPDLCRVVRHPRSMPQYEVGHSALVEAIELELSRFPRLALAGNAYRGVGIPDCVQSGEKAAERVFDALATRRARAPGTSAVRA